MALEAKSIDEITAEMVDNYDAYIFPKKIWRNHNNKLYLIFRSIAAGFKLLLDAVLSLRQRFDPLTCDEEDLYTTCKLVGTEIKQGTGSILQITVINKDETKSRMLYAGVYNYASASGMIFSFETANDYLFSPMEQMVVSAISNAKGSYPVTKNAGITLVRSDAANIDSAFVFSCADNSGRLGYPDEDTISLRQRLVNDTTRQDHIKELELKIRNLPNIFECGLVFNPSLQPMTYDDIELLPFELLVTITGHPTNEIAKLVAADVVYATHKISEDMVVYYENELYIGGRYAVYYKLHDTTDFSLSILYRYNREKLKPEQVEEALTRLLEGYTRAVTHVDTVSKNDIYDTVKNHGLPSVKVLDVGIMVNGEPVPFLRIPRTRLPHLTGIGFTAIDEGSLV
jgi:hypothetical protein